MKKITAFQIISFLLFICIQHSTAQKVMVVGFNYDTPDGFTLVALEDIPSSQPIFVTETPYDNINNNFDRSGANRGTWQINWTGTWTKGTILKFEGNPLVGSSGPGGPMATPTATSPYSDIVSFSNEGFSVFTASNVTDPDATPTEIYSYTIFSKALGSGTDPDPSDDVDCPCSSGFISTDLNSNIDHAEYNPSLRGDGTIEDAAALKLASNWNTSTINVSLDLTAFTSIVLPVELSFLRAAMSNNDEVVIKWQTQTEINNALFSLEHSTNGEKFESIEKINGAGTSYEPRHYSLTHKTPTPGFNYYRLHQIDFDGQSSYSNIVVIDFSPNNNKVSITPNPFNDELTVNMEKPFVKNTNLIIYNSIGQIVFSDVLRAEQQSLNIDLSNLQSGIFTLVIYDGEYNISKKILKL